MFGGLWAGLIDLLILGLLSWGGIIGWKRGGYLSLLDCMSVGSSVAVVLFSIPLVKDQLIDANWALQFRNWFYEHMKALPTLGSSTPQLTVADNLYHLLIVGAGALAVWTGIQIILKVIQIVLKEPGDSLASRIAGAMLGVSMGGALAVYMVQCLGLLSWLKGWEVLDFHLRKSIFVWMVLNWIVR